MSSSNDAPTSLPASFLSPDSFNVERIFPIRNLLDEQNDASDDELHNTPLAAPDVPAGLSTSADQFMPPPFPPVPAEDKIRKLPPTNSDSEYSSRSDGEGGRIRVRKVTQRAELVPEKHGGAPGATMSEGGKITFHRCEDEPIHIPGAIQQYGALLALKYEDEEDGNVLVRIASENSEHLIGYNPEQLFQLQSFCDLLDAVQKQDFLLRFNHVLAADIASGDTDLDVFTLSLLTRTKGMVRYWCALHLSAGTKDIVICEFEAQDDVFFPGAPGVQTLPRAPIHTTGNEAVEGEWMKSITSMSQPLRALSIARQSDTRVGYMEMFNSMTQVQSQLSSVTNLQKLLDVIVGIVREMTHFHRVMVYRFDKHHNGAVEAELLDPEASSDIFRGLSFPASDIPKQARDLYKINKIRVLYDRDSETARLVCRDESDFTVPLDLTHSYLRAISPIHLKYLANMGVRSSMSISLVINEELWGLVACHSYGDEGIKVPLPIRELCRNIGECASINIGRLLMEARLRARRPPNDSNPQRNPSGFIAASSADLLRTFDADFGLLSIQDEARTIGKLAPYREALALLAYLQKKKLSTIVATDNINADFANFKYAPGIKTIAGMLVIPVSMLGNDFIVFFRTGQLKEVRWAGNPYDKIVTKGTAEYLQPRSSFRRWTENVEGTSKEWTDDQLDTASILSLLYGRFIEVWRQKEMAVQRSRMTRLLLRNSSHEVRTPLNAIINYLEIALETNLDEITRDQIQKAHKASRALVYVIDDLLNLTKAEEGHVFNILETFDLGATVSDVISSFTQESIRRGLDLTVSTHPGLPTMVKGDPTRLRQVLSNITSNAFQNSASGGIKVDIKPISVKDNISIVSITIQDIGVGMSEKQLDDLFQEFEQILDDDEQTPRTPPTPNDKETLGLGLAVVARYVRNMHGRIKVRSELGKGTIFSIELPLEHVNELTIQSQVSDVEPSPSENNPASENPDPNANPPSSATDTSTAFNQLSAQAPPDNTPIPFGALALESFAFPHHAPQPTSSAVIPLQQKRAISAATPITAIPIPPSQSTYPFPDMPSTTSIAASSPDTSPHVLNVLIAEDNPINARMLQKRLEKTGHAVTVVEDGQSCLDTYCAIESASSTPYQSPASDPGFSIPFDAILMDIQMPLVDGHASTKMIRRWEYEQVLQTPPTSHNLGITRQQNSSGHNRVPIFAVSASLVESQRFEYVQNGFDGWLLKPIDYSRLEALLGGVHRRDLRGREVYKAGGWEMGGWFLG